jgi:tetratricopeptide (TPR) repeat protein
MWDLAVREEDYAAADSLLARYRGAPPWSRRALPAFAAGDSGTIARLLDEARTAENRQLQIGARYVAIHLEALPLAIRLAQLDVEWRQRPLLRQDAQLLVAWLEVARGRWSAARAAFATAARHNGAANVVLHRAAAATLPFLTVPQVDLEGIRDDLTRWIPELAGPEAGVAPRLAPHLRLYLLALVSSAAGRTADAARLALELERLPVPHDAAATVAGLVQTIRADLAWRAGRPAEALAALETTGAEVPLELVAAAAYTVWRPFSQEHARYLRAAALTAVGRDEEALRWLETGFQGVPNEFVYLAPLYRHRAEIHERLGQRARAVERYARFVELWGDCDPAMRPAVNEARASLARLAGQL